MKNLIANNVMNPQIFMPVHVSVVHKDVINVLTLIHAINVLKIISQYHRAVDLALKVALNVLLALYTYAQHVSQIITWILQNVSLALHRV